MNLQQLYYLESIVRNNSFTKAAEEKYVSVSNLSHLMADLEKELGTQLIIRDRRQIRLTEAGLRVLKHAQTVILELEGIRADVRALSERNEAVIRIGAGHSFNSSVVSDIIQLFYKLEENEGITFERIEGDAGFVQESLLKQTVDVGFNYYMGSELLNRELIDRSEVFMWVADSDFHASLKDVSFEEIRNMPIITYGERSGTTAYLLKMFGERGWEPNIVRTCTSDYSMMEMVSSGIGITILPRYPEVDLFPLKLVPIDGGIHRRDVYLMWRNDIEIQPETLRFIEFVRKYMVRDKK